MPASPPPSRSPLCTGLPATLVSEAGQKAAATFRTTLSNDEWTLRPIPDLDAPLDPRMAEAAERACGRIRMYPRHDLPYQYGLMFSFFSLLIAHKLYFEGIRERATSARRTDFAISCAGPGFDFREVRVVDGDGDGDRRRWRKEMGGRCPDFLGGVWSKPNVRKSQPSTTTTTLSSSSGTTGTTGTACATASGTVSAGRAVDTGTSSQPNKRKKTDEDSAAAAPGTTSSTPTLKSTLKPQHQQTEEAAGDPYSFLAFLVGEFGPHPCRVSEAFAREICYLHSGFTLCGCFVGFVIVRMRLARLIILDQRTVVVETIDDALQGQVMDIAEALESREMYRTMPHALGSGGEREINDAGWAVLWNTAAYAASLVADLPITKGLRRLEHPPKVSAWTAVSDLVAKAGACAFSGTPEGGMTDSEASEPPIPGDKLARLPRQLRRSVSRLGKLGVQVYWTSPETMTELIRDGCSGILTARGDQQQE